MIKMFFSALCIMLFSMTAIGQNAKLNASGNYEAIKRTAVKDSALQSTGKTFTDSKGKTYPVYVSATGKLFTIRTSKVYLKL